MLILFKEGKNGRLTCSRPMQKQQTPSFKMKGLVIIYSENELFGDKFVDLQSGVPS